jgi:hypothetical protein
METSMLSIFLIAQRVPFIYTESRSERLPSKTGGRREDQNLPVPKIPFAEFRVAEARIRGMMLF